MGCSCTRILSIRIIKPGQPFTNTGQAHPTCRLNQSKGRITEMNTWTIEGGVPLKGEIAVSGAKNSVTKLLVASMLSDQPSHFANVPDIGDRHITQEICESVGTHFKSESAHRLEVHTAKLTRDAISTELGNRNRLAIMMMGPLLHRQGRAVVPAAAGGDPIRPPPAHFHPESGQRMGP